MNLSLFRWPMTICILRWFCSQLSQIQSSDLNFFFVSQNRTEGKETVKIWGSWGTKCYNRAKAVWKLVKYLQKESTDMQMPTHSCLQSKHCQKLSRHHSNTQSSFKIHTFGFVHPYVTAAIKDPIFRKSSTKY